MGDSVFQHYLTERNKKHSIRMTGDKNPFYGKTHTSDVLYKISNANRVYSSMPGVKQRQREAAIERLRKNKYKMTKPERVMKSVLSELSVQNHYNFILDKRYQYDFRIINTNIIIEVQGDYWHCNPKIYPNGPVSERQKFKIQRDIEKRKYAEECGYAVVYVWEDELKNDIELVKEKVMYEIQTKENRNN
jgi:G:T-mismatch repair DNA endonuclease (very short patch repair protein)